MESKVVVQEERRLLRAVLEAAVVEELARRPVRGVRCRRR